MPGTDRIGAPKCRRRRGRGREPAPGRFEAGRARRSQVPFEFRAAPVAPRRFGGRRRERRLRRPRRGPLHEHAASSSTEVMPCMTLSRPSSHRPRIPPSWAALLDLLATRTLGREPLQVVVHHHQLEDADPPLVARCGCSAGSPSGGRAPARRAARSARARCGPPTSSSRVGVYISQQCVQSFRARRWASTAVTAEPVRNGSTPISLRRVSALGASFVCSVESTKWPVSADSIEIFAVSDVADLADHDHVGVGAQDRPQRAREGELAPSG